MTNDDQEPLTKGEFREFKNEVYKFQSQTQTHLDNLAKMISDLKTEVTMSFASYQRHADQLTDHERRLTLLEAKV